MRKSTVLTTFALVMLYSVASAYRSSRNTVEVAATTLESTATLAPEPTTEVVPTRVALSAVQAAQVATQVLGNSSLLSAESSNLNGVDAYKIIFTNNDVVYVGLDGQILSVQVAPVVVNVALPEKQKNKNQSNTNPSNGSGEDHTGSEESHEVEHED